MKDFLGKFVRAEQFKVKNQFIIYTEKGRVFQSYDTIICAIIDGNVYLDADNWDYSKTTGKYRNIFLREDINTTRKKIKDGTYKLMDLNV